MNNTHFFSHVKYTLESLSEQKRTRLPNCSKQSLLRDISLANVASVNSLLHGARRPESSGLIGKVGGRFIFSKCHTFLHWLQSQTHFQSSKTQTAVLTPSGFSSGLFISICLVSVGRLNRSESAGERDERWTLKLELSLNKKRRLCNSKWNFKTLGKFLFRQFHVHILTHKYGNLTIST